MLYILTFQTLQSTLQRCLGIGGAFEGCCVESEGRSAHARQIFLDVYLTWHSFKMYASVFLLTLTL